MTTNSILLEIRADVLATSNARNAFAAVQKHMLIFDNTIPTFVKSLVLQISME